MKALMNFSLLALAALWAGAALAENTGGASVAASRMENLAILLDLTDAQRPQVETILQGAHAQMRALFEQAKAAGGTPDLEALHAAREQIRQETVAKLAGVLSPTQLKKFQTLMQMQHHFGHRGSARSW